MSLIKKQKSTQIKKSAAGKLSKKAQTFLQICKESFGFEPAREFINLYANEQELYQELYLEYTDKKKRAKMLAVDVDMLWFLHKEIKDSLKTFIKYSYPTLRAMAVKGDIGTRPIFNINLGVPSQPEAITVTPEGD